MTTYVLIGDVHGNARALRAALAQARRGSMDRLVFMGDLLTYGHDVAEVLDLVGEAQSAHGADLLVGNHDKMYFDLAEGQTAYLDKLPDWIRDSVSRTLENIDLTDFRTRLQWSESVEAEGLFVAHANPFSFGDWRYLNEPSDIDAAFESLRTRGSWLGVFGHTHRARAHLGKARNEPVPLATPIAMTSDVPNVLNTGSIGQPRNDEGMLLRLTVAKTQATATFEAVDYDVDAHIAELRNSGLPPATIDRLCRFFVGR